MDWPKQYLNSKFNSNASTFFKRYDKILKAKFKF